MKIRFTAVIALFLLFVLTGCHDSDQAPLLGTGSDMPPLAITLGPQSSEYSIDDIFKGDVQFVASVTNEDGTEVTFAHPTICFPDEYRIGDSLDLTAHHGNSEILLTVEKPDGSVMTLRDGPQFFNPSNDSYFVIAPGQSDLFYIGWFFQNARGGWEDDVKAENVFTGRGQYKLKLLYRNLFPKALVQSTTAGKSHFIEVWTGEIESNTVTVTIQ